MVERLAGLRGLLVLRLLLVVLGLGLGDELGVERHRDHQEAVLGRALATSSCLVLLVLRVGLLLGVVGRARGELVAGAEEDLAEPERVDDALIGEDPDIALVREQPAVLGQVEALALERGDGGVRELDAFRVALLEVAGQARRLGADADDLEVGQGVGERPQLVAVELLIRRQAAGQGPRGRSSPSARCPALRPRWIALLEVDLVVVELDLADLARPRA